MFDHEIHDKNFILRMNRLSTMLSVVLASVKSIGLYSWLSSQLI